MKAFLGWLRYRREMNKLKRAGTFGIGGGIFLSMALFAFFAGGWVVEPALGAWNIVAAVIIILSAILFFPLALILL